MTEDDVTESYLRANVGYTWATNSLLVASPLDMAGLPGVFQTLAVLLTGITTIYRPSSYYQLAIFDQLDAKEISDADWNYATNGNVLGALPPPLALVQVSARRHRNEIAQQHARVRGSKMPVDQLSNIKMSRLQLTLVDGRRVNPTVWTPESKWCQQHPAWPGGNYQHELVWAYTEDGTTRPTWILLPHPTLHNQYILCNNNTSHQYGPQQDEQFTLLMPLPKIFFYGAHRRHLDRSLTAPGSLLTYAIPSDNDKPYLPQLFERLPDAAPDTPRQPNTADQGDPLPPAEAPAPAKVEEVPKDVRQNWHTALESFLKEYQTYPVEGSFEVNPSLLSALPCYWPLVRLTLNAKAAINRFRVSLRKVYYNDKLQGASNENALRTVHTQANELELMALTFLLHQSNFPMSLQPKSGRVCHPKSSGSMPFWVSPAALTENLPKELTLKMIRRPKQGCR